MVLCYRDRSYCSARCLNRDCSLNEVNVDRKHAEALGLPINFLDHSPHCGDYQPGDDGGAEDGRR